MILKKINLRKNIYMKMLSLKELKNTIDIQDNFLILMHIKPDGDSIGAAYALMIYLESKGKKAVIGIEEDIFNKYKPFIDENDYKTKFLDLQQIKKNHTVDTIIIVDCASFRLLGSFRQLVESNLEKCFIVDHHATGDHFECAGYINTSASSTSEIIIDFLENETFTFLMAQALYLGIVFDTGQFRYSSTAASVFRKIAFLLEQHRLDLEKVFFLLFENESLERKKVIASLVDSIQFYCNGEVAVAYLSKKIIKDLKNKNVNIVENDLIDLVVVPHSIRGVKVSVLVREKDHHITFSFRSRSDFNVDSIASFFGGGGHKKASGLRIENISLDEVENKIIKHLVTEYEKNN